MRKPMHKSLSLKHVVDPDTGELRVDPISLSEIPERYCIRLREGTVHDARELAKYIVAGGKTNPLTRRPWFLPDLQCIKELLRGHELSRDFQKVSEWIKQLWWRLIAQLATQHALAFVRHIEVVAVTMPPEAVLAAFKSTHTKYLKSSRHPPAPVHIRSPKPSADDIIRYGLWHSHRDKTVRYYIELLQTCTDLENRSIDSSPLGPQYYPIRRIFETFYLDAYVNSY